MDGQRAMHTYTVHINLRMRLYKTCECSILTYGSEAWHLTKTVTTALNDANTIMVSIITGNSPHGETSPTTRTFDLVRWVRARRLRLQWFGHIYVSSQMTGWLSKWYSRCTKPQPDDLLMSDGRSQKQSRGYKRAMEVQGTSTETTTHNNSQDGVTHRARTNIHLHDK